MTTKEMHAAWQAVRNNNPEHAAFFDALEQEAAREELHEQFRLPPEERSKSPVASVRDAYTIGKLRKAALLPAALFFSERAVTEMRITQEDGLITFVCVVLDAGYMPATTTIYLTAILGRLKTSGQMGVHVIYKQLGEPNRLDQLLRNDILPLFPMCLRYRTEHDPCVAFTTADKPHSKRGQGK